MKWWKVMKEAELAQFLLLLKLGYSIPLCAKELGRHKSTLYECLKTNGIEYNKDRYRYVWGKSWDTSYSRLDGKKVVRFNAHSLHLKRSERKSVASVRYQRIKKASPLALFIERKIKKRWSAKQISGSWRRVTGEQLSKDTIYRYVYSTHREWIRKYFRRKGREYIHHTKREALRVLDRRSIDLRPEEIETRKEFGHWEWDTVIWVQGTKACILTLVERKTGFLIVKAMENRKAESVFQTITQDIPKNSQYLMKSLTLDNGGEFALHSLIEHETRTIIYFAHPYRSSERWTNENTNGLLRQYFPKKTDFSRVDEKQLQRVVREINSRPRERLGYKTPYEAMREELEKISRSRKSV